MISQPRDSRVSHHERVLLLAAQYDGSQAEAELVRRYEPLIQAVCDRYDRPLGYDRQDLAQEARIGLWHAIHAWRPDRGPFPAFARVCVTRQAMKALDSAGARKHQLLSRADPLSCTAGTDDDLLSAVFADPPLTGHRDDPVAIVIGRERLARIVDALAALNDRERTVLVGSLNDRTCRQLAGDNGCTTQAVHGLLRRARLKLAARSASQVQRVTALSA